MSNLTSVEFEDLIHRNSHDNHMSPETVTKLVSWVSELKEFYGYTWAEVREAFAVPSVATHIIKEYNKRNAL